MKKLGKLTINPDKIIKNEELVNLRGGYEGGSGTCGAKSSSGTVICGVSKTAALFWVQGGGYWCCDTPSTYCNTWGS